MKFSYLVVSFVVGALSLPLSAAEEPSFSAPFKWGGNGHLVVEGKINDNLTLPMIVDTGAQFGIIPSAAAAELGYEEDDMDSVEAVTASDVRTLDYVTLDSVSVAGQAVEDLNSLVLDLGELGHDGPLPGVLPIGYLKKFTVHFDLVDKRIEFYPRETSAEQIFGAERVSSIPFEDVSGFIRFPVEVNGVLMPAILDTGASGNAIMNWAAAASVGVDRDHPGLRESREIKGAGAHGMSSQQFTFDTFVVGGQELPANTMDIADMPHFHSLIGRGAGVNMGLARLGNRSLVVDYKNKTLHLSGERIVVSVTSDSEQQPE